MCRSSNWISCRIALRIGIKICWNKKHILWNHQGLEIEATKSPQTGLWLFNHDSVGPPKKKTSLPGIPSIFAQNFSPLLRSNPLEKFQHPLQPKKYTPKSNPPKTFHIPHPPPTPCFCNYHPFRFFFGTHPFLLPQRKKISPTNESDVTLGDSTHSPNFSPRESDGFWLVVGPYKNTRHSPPGDVPPSNWVVVGAGLSDILWGIHDVVFSGECPKNRVKTWYIWQN